MTSYLDDDPAPRFKPPRVAKLGDFSDEETLRELNNLGRPELTEDFSDQYDRPHPTTPPPR